MQATATLLEESTISGEDFRLAMRRLAGGVSIISGAGPDGPLGVTATAVTSLTAEPPNIVCCLNRSLALEAAVKEIGSQDQVSESRVKARQLGTILGPHVMRGSERPTRL